MQDKVLSLLGLAERAGRVRSGGFESEEAVKKGRARLIILAEDASENTCRNFADMGAYHRVPVVRYGTKEALGHCIGKAERSCLAVTDAGFAARLQVLLGFGSGNNERGKNGENKDQ